MYRSLLNYNLLLVIHIIIKSIIRSLYWPSIINLLNFNPTTSRFASMTWHPTHRFCRMAANVIMLRTRPLRRRTRPVRGDAAPLFPPLRSTSRRRMACEPSIWFVRGAIYSGHIQVISKNRSMAFD